MDKSWLDGFHGQHVTVLTQAGNEEKSDTGTLLRVSDGWLQLEKDNGEMVLVPSTAIRLVKMLDMVHRGVAGARQPELEYPTRVTGAPVLPARSNAPDDEAVI